MTAGEWFNVMPYADEVFVVQREVAHELVEILNSNAKRILRKEEYEYHRTILAFWREGFSTHPLNCDIRYQIRGQRSSAARSARNSHRIQGAIRN